MNADLPVVVEIARADGSQEFIRVGTARRDGGHFVLDLGALRINPLELAPPPSVVAPASPPVRQPPAQGGTVEDLEYIAARARRTLADSSKARWHAQERDLLHQVEQELVRWFKAEKKSS